jgi:hypothetical protein
MAKNDFKVFATSDDANVVSQEDYEVLAARSSGFQSGIAKSAQLNKVWRQSSIVAAALAQFIVDHTGKDAIDNGCVDVLVKNLKEAIFNDAALTGVPTAPTPPLFDSSASLASTDFVQHALGSFNRNSRSDFGIKAGATFLTNDDIGGFHYFNGSENQRVTLPSEAHLPVGAAIAFQSSSGFDLTISTHAAEQNIDTTVGLATSITLYAGEFVELVWSGKYWQIFGTYTQRVGGSFSHHHFRNGYQKLPTDLIIQWGVVGCPSGYILNQKFIFNFPIAFSSAVLVFVGSNHGYSSATPTESYAASLSQGQVFWGASSVSESGLELSYIAIGR